jgi:hypothetical protein
VTEAFTVVLGIPVLLALDVEHLHALDSRAGRPEDSAQGTFPNAGPAEDDAGAVSRKAIATTDAC